MYLELYERYQQDPNAVDPETRAFFENFQSEDEAAPAQAAREPLAPEAVHASDTSLDVTHIVSVARLIRYIRELGHLASAHRSAWRRPPRRSWPGDGNTWRDRAGSGGASRRHRAWASGGGIA